jgi:hypothetical protein
MEVSRASLKGRGVGLAGDEGLELFFDSVLKLFPRRSLLFHLIYQVRVYNKTPSSRGEYVFVGKEIVKAATHPHHQPF